MIPGWCYGAALVAACSLTIFFGFLCEWRNDRKRVQR